MNDILDQIEAVHRELGSAPDGTPGVHRMLLRRDYAAPVEDVWDALTDAERIGRWLMPVSGDLRLGGTYQLEGNAGGEILACDPPKALKVTWVYGEPAGISELEVRLSPAGGGRTTLEIEHVAEVPEDFWKLYGPGATGIGWELALLGLDEHLAGTDRTPEEKANAHLDPGLRSYMTRSAEAWADVHRGTGVPADEVEAARQATLAAYAPSPESDSPQ